MKKKIQQKVKRTFTLKSHEIAVTQNMLYGVRDELMRRFNSHERQFASLEDKLIAEIRRVGVLVEEQKAQNIYVLDGITNLSDRTEENEQEIARLKNEGVMHKPLGKR